MLPKSIRRRLPLTYGAVALLATLFLGLTLVISLSSYYGNQEKTYLENNAMIISTLIGRNILPEPVDSPADHLQLLQSQVNTFAYVTQVQIRVYDLENKLLADSGQPQFLRATSSLSLKVAVEDQDQTFSQTIDTQNETVNSVIVVESGSQRIESSTSILGGSIEEELLREGNIPLSLLETPLTFGPGFTADSEIRSKATYRTPIINGESGLTGFVELSGGPAFGRSILQDVTSGLTLAAILATGLAAAVGWWMSTHISRPIQKMAQITEQMAAGDLSVRTEIDRQDELGQLANSFNDMAGQIEQTISTLRQFVADAAHELNTPLTALRTNLELASRQQPDSEYLQNAQRQAARLERLNDDLLRLSRLESGLSEHQYRSLNLTDLLHANAERFAAQAEQADLAYNLTTPVHSVTIHGSEEQLHRVIDNIFENALKFTPAPGEIKLTLTSNDQWATLTIDDTGLGIREEDLPFIFHRFHRGRNTADFPGSGLGLAMVKTIIDNHHGYLTVTSQPNQGTKISVRLPVIQ